ncbi:type IV secretion system protein VirD4 [Bordetella ansorpii]|uniref:Type IV secretion system protein VirD4 n=1 Tax=Bordetella ansorpii TaxID=288768 RepID=A0A157QM88_9BORD|nr:type IV secretion system DNA-binding domain-containing protein [Bordetella ansorpii]SAI46640.1 type IV secretion system protein VirD4 [Bordetella ansorpii]
MAPDIRRRLSVLALVLCPLASWLACISYTSGISIRQLDYRTLSAAVRATPHYPILMWAIGAGLVLALLIIITLLRDRSHTEGYDGAGYRKFIRGTRVVPFRSLRQTCSEWFRSQIDVAGVPMPTRIETLHLLLNGATGSGKTILLRRLVFSALRRGDRMVLVDPNGDLLSKFWRPGDIVLNPYDSRTEGWSFFNEVRADYDWKRFAKSVVPLGADANAEEWNEFGRLLLREAARKLYTLGCPSIEQLFRWCTIADPQDLRAFLTGTLAESLFAGSNEASKALTSARFVLSNKLSEHMSMPPGTFSIRDWMEDERGGNLFITWRQDMAPAMKPLVSAWVDVFCTSILSMPENYYRRWWLVIDELASLEKLPTLEDALTKGRKHGLRIVAGLQSVSQLASIYGERVAQTIRASFRSLVVLGGSKTDPETAEEMSKSLGEHEVARPEYTDSRQIGSRTTGERMVRSTERVVTPAQVQTLPDLNGYLAFSGARPISRFVLEPLQFVERTPAFIESHRISSTLPSAEGPNDLPQGTA